MSDAKEHLVDELKRLFGELAGQDLSSAPGDATFFDLGFDSLFLTQASQALRKKFGVKITFRQLLEDLTSLDAMASFLDGKIELNPSAPTPAPAAKIATSSPGSAPPHASASNGSSAANPLLEEILRAQHRVLEQQLALLGGSHALPAGTREVPKIATTPPKADAKPFGPYRPIDKAAGAGFTERQQQHLDALIERYARKTPESKRRTQEHRRHFSDPRSVSGFRPFWKEMVYPIITTRSAGARFWDVDGNEYIDLTMGFGTNLLGHAPEFITHAIEEQLKLGIEVGPQSPLAGEVAALLCELTGHERAAFCNTGSEAVLAAVRIARTVTGRSRIATTSGFHGINDEVLVRANIVNGERRSVPVAPGIPEHIVRDVLVLDYGTDESLELLKQHADELAAVLIEPVQSRHPDLQPRAFLHEARRITERSETALIFDEVINGFRCHLHGAQAHFGVKSDIGTWGKIIGGGMPIGAVTGSAQFMDALDGGNWQFGDASFPEAGVTFFAGTYVRHPLAMAASRAMLRYLKEQGPGLQQRLNERTTEFVTRLNSFLREQGAPLHIEHFSSLFYIHFEADVKYGSLLYFHLREKGLHIWEGRPCFLSTAHTDENVEEIIRIFQESVVELQRGGFFPEPPVEAAPIELRPPQPRIEIAAPTAPAAPEAAVKAMDFSLYFFGHYPAEFREDKYRLIVDSAKFADAQGFTAIWLPERHFHAHGGFSPNPSVLAAALANATQRVHLRGGSVVLPLHHPVRVAEEWSVVDNLSGGRTGISIASGWHPNDFVFAPDSFENRRELCHEHLTTIQRLWRGETLRFPTGAKIDLDVQLHPLPKQRELPVWLTCIHKESYVKAGELGVGVLGYLMNQSIEEAAAKISLYRESLVRHGHDPAKGHVTLLLHTFVGGDVESARAVARGPLREYLRTFLDNSQKRIETQGGEVEMEADDMDYLLDRAFEDYTCGKALIGSVESCALVVESLKAMGVDEIGCFVDFGISEETVRAHLHHLAALQRRCAGAALPAAAREMPLSDAQSGLWTVCQLGDDAARAYNEFTTLELRGPLDPAALRTAFQQLINRHEALRTTFRGDGVTLLIHPHQDFEIAVEDFSGDAEARREERLRACFAEFEKQAFDLTRGPLLRALLVRLGEDRHLLALMFHHLLGNGPSYWVFFSELTALYGAARSGRPVNPERPLQLGDYLRWRAARAGGAEEREDEIFWLDQFAGDLPVLELPTDHPRPAIQTFRSGRSVLHIDETLTRTLRETGARQRSSLFMVLFAAFKVWLFRLSGQRDIIVGVPSESAVRELPGGSHLFANTTNMLPLRTQLDGAMPFLDLLSATRSQVLAASEHQDYFFVHLLPLLRVKPDASRPRLFSVTFNYETGKFFRQAGGVDFEFVSDGVPYRNAHGISPFELVVNIAEKDGALILECDFNADLYSAETVGRWLGHYRMLLQSIVENPAQPIANLQLLDGADRERVLGWGRGARTAYPAEQTIHALFEQRVEETPDALALVDGELRLSYAALDERANRYANHLREQGFGEGDTIGLFAHRYWPFMAGMLGILKIGAAYVPLDPRDPPARTAMLQKQISGVIDEKLDVSSASAVAPPHAGCPDGAAYVMFTSGSTGEPKGVVISHRGVTRLVCTTDYVELDRNTVMMQSSNLGFDASTFEIWGALLHGGVLVFTRSDMVLDHCAIAEHVAAHGINTLFFTTSLFNQHARQTPGLFAGLRCVVFGGEAADASMVNRVLAAGPPRLLVNGYGPTETTTFAICQRIEKPASFVPIGRPIANTDVFILDASGQLVPPGLTGEIHIGGPGVALGYLNRRDLTAESFLETEFGRLYRTGDFGRWLADGTIEYQGRKDEQFKLRGFRIEPAEIEAQLRTHPAIAQCAVVPKVSPSGEKVPVAYLVRRPDHPPIGEAEFRRYLVQNLPPPFVPYQWFWLGALPLTANGKLDHRALPEPVVETKPMREFVPPQDSVQAQLVAIWEEALMRKPIGVQDDFFDLGGHSLIAIRLIARIREAFQIDLPIHRLFSTPNIAGTAEYITAHRTPPPAAKPLQSLIAIQTGDPRQRPFFLVPGGWGAEVEFLVYGVLARHVGADLPLYGLKARGSDGVATPHHRIAEMVADYVEEIRAHQPHGPYLIGGECVGGVAAYEIARTLEAQGEKVALLVLLGTRPPGAVALRRFHSWDRAKDRQRFWDVRIAQPFQDHLENLSKLPLAGKLKYVWTRATRERSWSNGSVEPSTPLDSRKVLAHYPRMLMGHKLGAYRGKVTLLIDETSHGKTPAFGWDAVHRGELEVHVLPGTHLSYIREFVAVAAAKLREIINLANHPNP